MMSEIDTNAMEIASEKSTNLSLAPPGTGGTKNAVTDAYAKGGVPKDAIRQAKNARAQSESSLTIISPPYFNTNSQPSEI
jgi:hypothetical protein